MKCDWGQRQWNQRIFLCSVFLFYVFFFLNGNEPDSVCVTTVTVEQIHQNDTFQIFFCICQLNIFTLIQVTQHLSELKWKYRKEALRRTPTASYRSEIVFQRRLPLPTNEQKSSRQSSRYAHTNGVCTKHICAHHSTLSLCETPCFMCLSINTSADTIYSWLLCRLRYA